MTASSTAQAILDALSAVDGLTVVTADRASSLATFPAVVVALPELGWSTYNTSLPTTATYSLHVVVRSDGFSLPPLESAVSEVVAALWAVTDVVVTAATPGQFIAGSVQLPAYLLTCEASL
jgi:hypothetical protein